MATYVFLTFEKRCFLKSSLFSVGVLRSVALIPYMPLGIYHTAHARCHNLAQSNITDFFWISQELHYTSLNNSIK